MRGKHWRQEKKKREEKKNSTSVVSLSLGIVGSSEMWPWLKNLLSPHAKFKEKCSEYKLSISFLCTLSVQNIFWPRQIFER
jgi:hypothetical protein